MHGRTSRKSKALATGPSSPEAPPPASCRSKAPVTRQASPRHHGQPSTGPASPATPPTHGNVGSPETNRCPASQRTPPTRHHPGSHSPSRKSDGSSDADDGSPKPETNGCATARQPSAPTGPPTTHVPVPNGTQTEGSSPTTEPAAPAARAPTTPTRPDAPRSGGAASQPFHSRTVKHTPNRPAVNPV